MNDEIQITAICSCEKLPISLVFGISVHRNGIPEESDWVIEGMTDSFWENYYEFEPGIEKASHLLEDNPKLSKEQAILEVFGRFSILYKVDGEKKQLAYDIDPHDEMIYILESEVGL